MAEVLASCDIDLRIRADHTSRGDAGAGRRTTPSGYSRVRHRTRGRPSV